MRERERERERGGEREREREKTRSTFLCVLIYRLFCSKLTFESLRNTAVNAAVFCLAICACDVMKIADVHGRRVYYVMRQTSSDLLL